MQQKESARGKAMDVAQLSKLVDEFDYILAKISKYLKNNQYVYLRAFDSWKDSYNKAAAQLNADKTITVPIFKLSPIDYSPTRKSIKMASVEKFVKTINHQVVRLQDKIDELNKTAEQQIIRKYPLERFFHRTCDGIPIIPPPAEQRIFIAIPPGDADLKLFWQGIQPALETHGLSFFRTDQPLIDDAALSELCQELHSCRLAILNLSGQTSNVMLALGLAYGIDKPLIILQAQDNVTLGEQNNNGYLRFTGADDLKRALGARLSQLLKS
jgi:hypothetical protein